MPALAAEWSAEPRISVRSGYNDNIRLTTREHDSVWETSVTPGIKFGGAEENRILIFHVDFVLPEILCMER